MTRGTFDTFFVNSLCHNVYEKKNWTVVSSTFSLYVSIYFEQNGTHFNKYVCIASVLSARNLKEIMKYQLYSRHVVGTGD